MTGSTHKERVTSYREPNSGKKYRLETNREIVDRSPRGVPIWEITLEIPPVPLMSDEEIVEHVQSGTVDLTAGFKASVNGRMAPGVLYNKDEAWQCGFCPVVKRCHDYEMTNNNEQFIELQKVKTDAKSK